MVRSMNGVPLPVESKEMVSIVAYLKFLSSGIAVGAKTDGRGAGDMAKLARAADPKRGSAIYTKTCAECHGGNGLGQRAGRAGDAQGYTIPPLWGPDSYNDGAGMGRLIMAANYIHNNMPSGTTWKGPAVSIQDAWDVAAYLNAMPRPHLANREKDFPNRAEKPLDTPYGPYADKLSVNQHKFGPFNTGVGMTADPSRSKP
jgi:thiosulfate dehydrogenase